MSTIASKPNKATALARVQALIAGTLKYFPGGSFTLGDATYTTESLIQEIRSLEQAMIAVNAAQQGARDAMAALRQKEVSIAPLLRAYRHYLLSVSFTSSKLAEFGLQPSKAPKPLGSEQRTTATVKMRATRVARGTMSKKQKLAITGNVTGIVVTPITKQPASPPAASPAAPPATTASSAAVTPVSTPTAPRT